jgi:arsenate reductase (thioredoxin)
MKRILFVCVQNSARSQIAEAFVNTLCAQDFVAESAGLQPGTLNPLAVETMREVGIDISGKSTQSVFELFKTGRLYSYVITVCDETSAEACPIFPGIVTRMHWSIPDPAALEGSWDERIRAVREIRDTIRGKVLELCGEPCPR